MFSWIVGYTEISTAAMYNALVVGVLMAAFFAIELAKPQAWKPSSSASEQ